MCYYPKTGIKKAIKSALTPRGDWDLHVVKRLSHKEITCYQTARDKEKKAMYTSAVDSEDTHSKQAKSILSPNRKHPQRYMQSSESESECGMGKQYSF